MTASYLLGPGGEQLAEVNGAGQQCIWGRATGGYL